LVWRYGTNKYSASAGGCQGTASAHACFGGPLQKEVGTLMQIVRAPPRPLAVTYLAPCPGALPAKYLLAGAFKVYLD
jgi:hypothetical protein